MLIQRTARLFAQVRWNNGLGGAASFSRSRFIEVLDAIHDTLYALSLASMPNALLFSKPTPRLSQEVFLQSRGIELLPVRTGRNAKHKLDLVLVPFVNAPKLPTC